MGKTVDISQVLNLALNTGTEVVADQYQTDQLYFPLLTSDIITPAQASDPLYGDKSTTLVAGGDPIEREDGHEIEATTAGEGYVPQGKIRQYSRKISIPERLLQAANGQTQAVSMIQAFTEGFTRAALIKKDTYVADLFNNGFTTDAIFDGSYPGNADASGNNIYDSTTFFSDSHPLKFVSGSAYDNRLALSLTSANMDTAYTQHVFTNAVDERGKRIVNIPEVLLVPPQLRQTALQILQSELEPGTSTNARNTNFGLMSPIVHPFLTDTNRWFIGGRTGIRVIDSGAPVPRTWFDEDTRCVMYSLEYHFGAYVRDWRRWTGSEPS